MGEETLSTDHCVVRLEPLGRSFSAPLGTPLRHLLFEQGVEFPCGGNGRCRGCRIRILHGEVPVDDIQKEKLSASELAAGWRLGCQCHAADGLAIELRQWDASILGDNASFSFTPQGGFGVAVDLGTTTIVAQLLDRQTGQVLGVRTALNPQAKFGGDIMSRINHAMIDNGLTELRDLARSTIGGLIAQLVKAASIKPSTVRRVVLVGNTVMHHIFCGIDVTPLAFYPFTPVDDGLIQLTSAEVGWTSFPRAQVDFLPCLGGFVGSDIAAGILASGIHESKDLSLLMDLGTNGEVVIGNVERLLCASAAAGPAFEGARISCGMRASTGAIWKVANVGGDMFCETLGQSEPTGICGSGLVDAIAACLDNRRISRTGRIADGSGKVMLHNNVSLTQADVRQFQLAKGAIAASVLLLLEEWGATLDDVKSVTLAGAFGNYVSRESACRVGLLEFPIDKIEAAGNTALLGAKIALCTEHSSDVLQSIRDRTVHISLNASPKFQDTYVEAMDLSPIYDR
jgi:uncharacterized 2Fe-2S/4Fe-4S cluster protein (DUF4445 family)